MPQCIVPGCNNNAEHNISVRCRRPNTSAIWAPNTTAYLCDEHAEQGCIIDVTITPTNEREVTTNVTAGGRIASRTTPINHDADE